MIRNNRRFSYSWISWLTFQTAKFKSMRSYVYLLFLLFSIVLFAIVVITAVWVGECVTSAVWIFVSSMFFWSTDILVILELSEIRFIFWVIKQLIMGSLLPKKPSLYLVRVWHSIWVHICIWTHIYFNLFLLALVMVLDSEGVLNDTVASIWGLNMSEL